MNRYNIGQTIPNTYPGGFKLDLTRPWYHKSVPELDDAKLPTTSVRNIKFITLIFGLSRSITFF
jgi:hypothetical protein